MAIKTNHADPLVGGVFSSDDQARERAARANWIGAPGATADNNGGAPSGSRADVDLS